MGISKLSEEDMKAFDKEPEIGMDFHVGKTSDSYVIVASGRTVITYDEGLTESLADYKDISASADRDGDSVIEHWWHDLPISASVSPVPAPLAFAILGFIHLGPVAPLLSKPPLPLTVYGHLPFHGLCSGSDTFYRFEAYPKSRRIDVPNSKVILPGTYCVPPLELPFIKSGLGAVARYALPSLLPARWGYELKPPAKTPMKYGASVPLFGQAGGGVETFFPNTFTNNGKIIRQPLLPIF